MLRIYGTMLTLHGPDKFTPAQLGRGGVPLAQFLFIRGVPGEVYGEPKPKTTTRTKLSESLCLISCLTDSRGLILSLSLGFKDLLQVYICFDEKGLR